MKLTARTSALTALLLLAGGCASTSTQASTSTGATGSTPPAASASSAAPAPGPSYQDITTGSTTSYVRVHSYDAAQHSAVVEPTAFSASADACADLGIDQDDPRCEQPYIIADSETRVTLPVADDVALHSVQGGNPDCFGDKGEGTCDATAADVGDWPLVLMTTEDGTITALAEMYLP